jgi:putative tryptophan/tyrosine transport system substrate-binding protein
MRFDRLKRREFITLIGGAAAAWPLAARAQQAALPVVGFLSSRTSASAAPVAAAFRKGLSAAGWVEGQNVAIEYRLAEDQYDRLASLADDLVHRDVTVIAAISGTPAALAAKAATASIPIIFANGGDPVTSGLVTSLNRPSGNITGVTFFSIALAAKRLELLRELVPSAERIAFLVNPNNPVAEAEIKEASAAARALGMELRVLTITRKDDIDSVFAILGEWRADGLLVGSDPSLADWSEELAALATKHHLPAIFTGRADAEAGGLLSYGISSSEAYRQAGIYAGRILKGDKPADLPVTQPTKFELLINLKTVKALGLTVPLSILMRLDEVIE